MGRTFFFFFLGVRFPMLANTFLAVASVGAGLMEVELQLNFPEMLGDIPGQSHTREQ